MQIDKSELTEQSEGCFLNGSSRRWVIRQFEFMGGGNNNEKENTYDMQSCKSCFSDCIYYQNPNSIIRYRP